jgi:TPR repeat protein
MHNLGLYYKNGTGNGIGNKINKKNAFELYQNAANLGNKVTRNNLAIMYEDRDKITKDVDKAIYWYEKLSNKDLC